MTKKRSPYPARSLRINSLRFHYDMALLIDAYRLRTTKKHGIGDTVLYLVIGPKEEALVRGLTGIHLCNRKLLGY
ncbi:MAG: hypothetical protein JRJ77_06535 [Deltaproteobacteria bacterium]|nr:hypothetical protein [Deltaproteobacteria bacterium]MBW2338835.1 hypothetical protein [Deltaproteobacteria bacterium]